MTNQPTRQGNLYGSTVINGGTVQLGDLYLSLDARSLEAPALALALFHNAIARIDGDSYPPNSVTQTSTFLTQSLRNQQAVFQQSLQTLLAPTLSEFEVNRLFEDWTDPGWKQDDLKNGIIARLGDGAEEMLEAANGICKTLSKLIKKLPAETGPGSTSRLSHARTVIKSFCFGSKRKVNAASLHSLKADITSFQSLTQAFATQSCLSVSKTEAEKHLDHVKLVHKCAEGLYEALRVELQHDCPVRQHPANIEIDTWSSQVENTPGNVVLKFYILLAASAEDASFQQWMTAKVEIDPLQDTDKVRPEFLISRSPRPVVADRELHAEYLATNATSNELPAEGLCEKLRTSQPFQYVIAPITRQMSRSISMTSDDPSPLRKRHSLRLAEGLRSPSEDVFSSEGVPSWLQLHPRHRIHLGLMLAWGVLQISSTGWLEGYWTADNILLVKDSSERPKAYVTHLFESSQLKGDAASSPTLAPLAVNNFLTSWTRSSVLFALGIFLIEMCYNKVITQLSAAEDMSAGEAAPIFTALRLGGEVHNQLGLRYAKAVKACLKGPAHSDSADDTINQNDFAIYVHTNIVQPLQEAASIFEDM